MTVRPSADKRGGAALCCQCGNLRSNGPKHVARDVNRSCEIDLNHPQRWRMTRTIHCPVCEMPTCHAMLCRGSIHRDNAEKWDYRQVRRSQKDEM
jgi:hypothetical protein